MKSVEENIDSLSRAIMSEARGDAEQVLADAKSKADATLKQAQERANAEQKEILDRARQEAERIRSQKVASTQLKARTLQLDSREKLLNRVYTTALQELSSVQQWTNYEEIARNLLRDALKQLKGSEVQIRADEKTMTYFPDPYLEQLSREMNVQIKRGEPLTKATGVIVETSNGRVQVDNTLETRLQRMWNELRSPVYHLLMGEAL